MDLQLKKELWEQCVAKQKEVIRHLQQEIKDVQEQSNAYGQPKDRYDPYKTKLMRQRDMFAKQLAGAELVMNTLQRLPCDKVMNEAAFGALVKTTEMNLFVSAGLGKMTLHGETFYAISPAVPVFKAMAGKKSGESFTFNGKTIKILEIV